MNTWLPNPLRESSIVHSDSSAGEPIITLYLTVDLAAADRLVYEMHRVAPNLRLDVSPRVPHAIDRLKSRRHRAVLVDHGVSRKDRSRLIAHIRKEKLQLPVILIFGDDEDDPTYQTLKAGADERIVKSPSFARDLPAVIEKALARYESDDRRPSPAPLYWEDSVAEPAEPKKEIAAGRTGPPGSPSAAPTRRPAVASGRRSSPRYEVYIPCRVLWEESSYDGCIHDLSREGAFVETPARAPAGSVVRILLTVAAAELQLEATVSHYGWYMTAVRNFDGIGVRFQNLSQQADDTLEELRTRSSAPAPPKTPLER